MESRRRTWPIAPDEDSEMEAKHTPGPWIGKHRDWKGMESPYRIYIAGDPRTSFEEDDDGDASLCDVATAVAIVEGNATSLETTAANARLIAVAPDLLEAC